MTGYAQISVGAGLSAFFKQANGPSRPGVDWQVTVSGNSGDVTLIVRTYFQSSAPDEKEELALAEGAVECVKKKLEAGWTPQTGDFVDAEME